MNGKRLYKDFDDVHVGDDFNNNNNKNKAATIIQIQFQMSDYSVAS